MWQRSRSYISLITSRTPTTLDNETCMSILMDSIHTKSISKGIQLHAQLIINNKQTQFHNKLISLYAIYCKMKEARQLFDKMPNPKTDTVAWNDMIRGYTKIGNPKKALEIYNSMENIKNLRKNSFTYTFVIKACGEQGDLEEGRRVHNQAIEKGYARNPYFASSLIEFYGKCGCIEEARKVFDEMPPLDPVAANTMIAGYVHNDLFDNAIDVFCQMYRHGLLPTPATIVNVLPAFAYMQNSRQSEGIHSVLIRLGYEVSVPVSTALLDMYFKCGLTEQAKKVYSKMSKRNELTCTAVITGFVQNGLMEEARQIFDTMPCRDAIVWNSMIAGYVQNGYYDDSIDVFLQMYQKGIIPTPITVLSILPAFAYLHDITQSETLHGILIRLGYEVSDPVNTALLDMYFKCGLVEHGRRVFDRMLERNELTWNTMIAGLVHNGCNGLLLGCFREMQHLEIIPCTAAVASMLKVCGELGDVRKGQSIHGYVVRREMSMRDINVDNSVVAMYAKFGDVESAYEFFERMQERDVVSWTAIISGYSQNCFSYQSLELLRKMQADSLGPDVITCISVLPSCAQISALKQGKSIHAYLLRHGMMTEDVSMSGTSVVNALIDMYAKCGEVEWAERVFEEMPEKDNVSWSTMILGHGVHGNSDKALCFFSRMKEQGICPNVVTFIGILTACCHAGLVEEGRGFFESMSKDYNISPDMNHYITMVNLLGRAGYLDEAHRLIECMPIKPDPGIWCALLNACKIHKNTQLAEYVERTHFRADSDT